MKLFDIDDNPNWFDGVEKCKYFAEIQPPEPLGIYFVLKIGEQHYSIGMVRRDQSIAGVHKIEYNPDAEEEYDTQFKCPCCGYIDRDAWELPEGEDETECGRCGAKLRYGKSYTVHYNVELVEPPPVIEIGEGAAQ